MVSGQDIAVLILAAGSSSRMGHSKQLISVGGETLLVRSVRIALESGSDHVVVVLGANEERHRAALRGCPVDIICNGYWQRGMGSSLKAGVSFIAGNCPAVEGVVIMVCDQPLVTAGHIVALVEASVKFRKPMVASWYSNTPGVPAYFHKDVFPSLYTIDDAAGAKSVFRTNADAMATISFPDGQVDIDSPTDLERFLKK